MRLKSLSHFEIFRFFDFHFDFWEIFPKYRSVIIFLMTYRSCQYHFYEIISKIEGLHTFLKSLVLWGSSKIM